MCASEIYKKSLKQEKIPFIRKSTEKKIATRNSGKHIKIRWSHSHMLSVGGTRL